MEDQKKLDKLRHSSAHLLAAAVLELYPDTKLTIGPAIENGFYYDFDFTQPINDDDLPRIEDKMAEILKTWTTFTHREVSPEEAKNFYKDNPYKLELIDDVIKKGEKITFYKIGDFEDLCRGGHSDDPAKDIGSFKLLSLAGAYWRGDEKNKMLTRIYGTAFSSIKDLETYLLQLEEAKKRDHKRLGREMELFWFDETAPGMAYWLPKGLVLYNNLYTFIREMYTKFGYQEVATPIINKKELYETSGHWEHYKDDMFLSPMSYLTGESEKPLEGSEVFGIKPMNCPNAMKIFGFKTRSYNDLPLRLAETTQLHRFELSGTLNGLFRIRQFRQDDAHVFITADMVQEEFLNLMDMIRQIYEPFGITYKLRFGTKPEKALGEDKDWKLTEEVLEGVLKESGEEFFKAEGEGAFYGPKVDILMKDSLGREWQTGTVQLDIQQPKRFDLVYTDSDGSQKMPFVFHRAILGSFERFIGILTEHYGGKFPLWLAPVQVMLLPISEKHTKKAEEMTEKLKQKGIRVEINSSNNTLQHRIREATLQKVPFMGIIGDREIENNTISLRSLDGQTQEVLKTDHLISNIVERIDKKT